MSSRLLHMAKRRLGLLGAFAYSGANFALAFTLQASVTALEFGLYAFALVCIQFGTSLSNALFASPMVVSLADDDAPKDRLIASYFRANIIFCALGALLICGALSLMGMPPLQVWLVGLQAVFLWMRWFFRAYELASHNFTMPALADMVYCVATLTCGTVLFALNGLDVTSALISMSFGTVLSLFVIGKGTVRTICRRASGSLQTYVDVFKQHGRWALLGVITTEAMANLHSYVITIFLGPAAFAPVATLALFFRPIPILMQAITQYERPVLARSFRAGDFGGMKRDVRKIHVLLTAVVLFNTIGVLGVIAFFPSLIGNGQYATAILLPLALLLAAGQLVRSLRTGSSAALQGAGAYKPLALVTVIAAPITILGTLVAIWIGQHTVALILTAVLLGEVVTAVLITRHFNACVHPKGAPA
ncbi:lipopolysaccharide biosynthesis protein [Celeribacter sp.]|uniref:lipopolysaccharide biosynthesis protein n=1 Tax=Celeribacter sp. TaxID=1890673 RepID=UPI003A93F155